VVQWPFGRKKSEFSALVAAHQTRVFRFVLKHLGNRPDAEDITQDVFLEAYRGYEAFQGRSLPSTWLLGIAVNMIRNHFRRSPERRYHCVPDDILADLPGSDDPLLKMETRRKMETLHQALFRLPDDSREVLACVVMEGLSYEQTATILDIPIGTVRSRLSRARTRLAADLAGKEMDAHV